VTSKTRWNGPLRALRALCALSALGLPVHAQAKPPAPAPGWAPFTDSLRAYVTADRIYGASAVLVRNGQVIRHLEIGLADRDSMQEVDERTIYHWASVTKTLTAVAIMQLRDHGRLSLDDKVTTWVPELRQVHNPYGSMDDITIRMLLSHTSGFQNPTWPYGDGKPWEPFEPTRWDQLVAMMPYQEIHFPPGSKYGYSNPGFIYLARIIEAITGDPYQSYIQKNIWTPLGMTRSYFGTTPWLLAADRANSYAVERDSTGHETIIVYGRDFDPGITIPNGGWNAPVADVVAWIAFLTSSSRGDTALARRHDTVLRRSSIDEMWRPMPLTGGGVGPFGLSFTVDSLGGATLVGHTGAQAGFRLFLSLNPATSEAFIIAFNTANDDAPDPAPLRAMLRSAAAMLGAKPK
jgi:CubicO group peptidase (beta-lactamase class C family)